MVPYYAISLYDMTQKSLFSYGFTTSYYMIVYQLMLVVMFMSSSEFM